MSSRPRRAKNPGLVRRGPDDVRILSASPQCFAAAARENMQRRPDLSTDPHVNPANVLGCWLLWGSNIHLDPEASKCLGVRTILGSIRTLRFFIPPNTRYLRSILARGFRRSRTRDHSALHPCSESTLGVSSPTLDVAHARNQLT